MHPTQFTYSTSLPFSAQDLSVSRQLYDFLKAHTNIVWGSGVEVFDQKAGHWHPVHRNLKQDLIRKFVFGHKVWASVLTHKDVERHLEGSEKFYFTGSKYAEDVLIYLDADCHETWQDDPDDAVVLLRSLLPKLYVCSSARGRNGYLLLRRTNRNGFRVPSHHVNDALRLLELSLRKLFLYHKVKTTIEVKGHLQHVRGTSYYCGKLAKLPNFGGMTSEQMDALRYTSRITIPVIKQFAEWVDSMTGISESTVRAYYRDVRTTKDRPPPSPCEVVSHLASGPQDRNQGSPVEVKRQPPAPPAKTAAAVGGDSCGRSAGDSFETGFHVCLELARKLGRVPSTGEVLNYLRVSGLFTGTWEENEAKRAGRIAYNLDYIAKIFDPGKVARKSSFDLSALDLTEYVGWVERHYPDGIACATVEDVNAFLAITKFCLLVDPNENGSLPYQRFKSIWQKLYAEGLVKRQFRWDRWKQIRDRLKSDGVIEIFGKPERRTAQKWRVGQNFPGYDRLSSLSGGSHASTATLTDAKKGRRIEGGSDLTLCLQDEMIRFHQRADEASELVHRATFGCWSSGEEGEGRADLTLCLQDRAGGRDLCRPPREGEGGRRRDLTLCLRPRDVQPVPTTSPDGEYDEAV